MIINPVLISIIGSALIILIGLLGYFLNRTLQKQDERNAEQSKINNELRGCFDTLNKTLGEILVDNRWRKEVCAERHSIINGRLKDHNEQIQKLQNP